MTNTPLRQPPDFAPRTQSTTEHTLLTTPKRQNLKVPIILMAWPPFATVFAIVVYTAISFIFAQQLPPEDEGEMFGPYGTVYMLTNVLLFSVGAISVLLGPISFVYGLILLLLRIKERT